jgi:ribosomal protein L11 methyltransferase
MTGCALDVRGPEELRDAIAVWVVERTGHAVEERPDGTLVGFAPNESEAEGVLRELRAAFGGDVAGSSRPLADIAWEERWREGLGPRRIGRLTIQPSWAVPADCHLPSATSFAPIVIDPEMAFGTGEHGSTRTALVLLDRHLRPGDRVLDLGSGSGILAIAAAQLGAARATGVELDAEAEPVALGNAARNGVADRVAFVTGDAAALAPLLGPAEVILSNILRSANAELLPAIAAALAPAGTVIFAGMEQDERELFLTALSRAGFIRFDEAADGAWWGVAARRG